MLRTLFVLLPIIVSAAVAWPMAVARAIAAPASSIPSALHAAVDAGLERIVPGAAVNGLDLVSVEQRPLGIGEWEYVVGTARVGSGDAATEYRFSGRFDPASGRVAGLRARAVRAAPTALAAEGRKLIEAAVQRQLAAEFPEQTPRFTLVGASRVAGADDGERVFQGRGRIDFGEQGEVLAPVEVRFDADSRITALRYSLDQLDPVPFDDATVEPASAIDALVATR